MKSYNFKDLLKQAISEEGKISECYSLLHDYSFCNSYLLYVQQRAKKQEVKPCGSFTKWKSLGGKIKKGSKAMAVFIPKMKPVFIKNEETGKEEKVLIPVGFFLKNVIFSLNDVDNIEPKAIEKLKDFDIYKACKNLGITIKDYAMIDGNCQGYAIPEEKAIALNPLAENPLKTLVHEVAHCILHQKDADEKRRRVQEVEAECTAYLTLNVLGKTEYNKESRGYIQHWLDGAEVEEKTAQRIFGAVNKILKAGR